LHSAAAHAQFMTIEIFNSYCAQTLNLFACSKAKYGDPMYDTHLISGTRSLNSPSLDQQAKNI
jgi:hypothetical protein